MVCFSKKKICHIHADSAMNIGSCAIRGFKAMAALSSWTVEQLKEYLRENNLPLSGN
jgi:hypothetical protein